MYHNDKSGWITGKGDSACFGLWGRTLGRVQARRKNRPRVLILRYISLCQVFSS